MRIDTNSQTMVFGVQPVMRTNETTKSRYASAAQGAEKPFQVQLSDLMAKVAEVQPSNGEVRWEKVNQIKDQLAQGSYQISGQDVAAKMLQLLHD
ncbi:MAG: flagellar biosynthesis anti-sigma factor FlgM [Elusimicrobiales bacterium]